MPHRLISIIEFHFLIKVYGNTVHQHLGGLFSKGRNIFCTISNNRAKMRSDVVLFAFSIVCLTAETRLAALHDYLEKHFLLDKEGML